MEVSSRGPVDEDDAAMEEDDKVVVHEARDEGCHSALDCTTCKRSLMELEESYRQQITALELKLLSQQDRIDRYYYIKNELTNDEENFLEGKGKGGKRYIRKACDLKQLVLKERYLSTIKDDEKRRFRFLRLDHEAQQMICKIGALRGCGSDDHFIDELLETFERMSIQLQRLKKIVEKKKELEGVYVRAIDKLICHNKTLVAEKDQGMDCLRNNVQVVLVGNERTDHFGELRTNKSRKKSKKGLKSGKSDDECQIMITNMEALREIDNAIYKNVVKMLGWQK